MTMPLAQLVLVFTHLDSLIDVGGGRGLAFICWGSGVREAIELILVDGLHDLAGNRRQFGLLSREVCVKVVPVFLRFL